MNGGSENQHNCIGVCFLSAIITKGANHATKAIIAKVRPCQFKVTSLIHIIQDRADHGTKPITANIPTVTG